MRVIAAVLIGLILSGCTKYQYKLVEPPELATHIGAKTDARVPLEPLEYVLRTVDNRLVIRIYNPTGDTIQLAGESGVVDSDGQSHPLPLLTLLPQSYGKLILPPPRPRFQDTRPTIGFGVGVGVSHHHHQHYAPYHFTDVVYEPVYFDVYSDSDPFYWDWKGEGAARLMLIYQRGEERFQHNFVFQRVKM